MAEAIPSPGEPRHVALFYGTEREYRDAVAEFVAEGLTAGQTAFVAVPGPKIEPLRDALAARAADVAFADMTEMGRNPAWIIPRVQAVIDASDGRPVRYVGEPIWAERSAEELREATRHEALINLAFAEAPALILCPYDTRRLDASVLAGAERTHPALRHGDVIAPSARYDGLAQFPADFDGPLPPCPPSAETFTYRSDLTRVRTTVGRHARAAGLPAPRVFDLVLSVSELAANTLRHADGRGTLRIWHDAAEIVCEVSDGGHIKDPLVGRYRPAQGSLGGHGLWIVHQACDLVELRSGAEGTTIRLHMRRPMALAS